MFTYLMEKDKVLSFMAFMRKFIFSKPFYFYSIFSMNKLLFVSIQRKQKKIWRKNALKKLFC